MQAIRYYTDDFDQSMLDFIEHELNMAPDNDEWDVTDEHLTYSSNMEFYWTCNLQDLSRYEYLTKQQFKEKIGMTTKQFTKADLVAGKHVVETNNGYSYIFIGNNVLQGLDNLGSWNSLKDYDEDLSCTVSKGYTIKAVHSVESGSIAYSKDKSNRQLVWERTPPKTETQIQFEKLQQQITELQAQADKLKATL